MSGEFVPLMERSSFGPPVPISAELEALRDMPVSKLSDFDFGDALTNTCVYTHVEWIYAPSIAAVDAYLAWSKCTLTIDEVQRFKHSYSYEAIASEDHFGGYETLSPNRYIEVALRYGDWRLSSRGPGQTPPNVPLRIMPPIAFYAEVASYDSELTPLLLAMSLSEPERGYLGELPLGVASFVAARCPKAFKQLAVTTVLLEYASSNRSFRLDDGEVMFRSQSGDEWLAWTLLVANNRSYWGGQGVSVQQGLSTIQQADLFAQSVIDVNRLSVSVGGFDAAAPYIEAGVPFESINAVIASDIAPDLAARLR